ncbi:MAG TPA: PASTA domain-containing protein [Gaiellaceae bacterium]|nr:PASTA domain-containing protein [Gaiellaceae bacterium]
MTTAGGVAASGGSAAPASSVVGVRSTKAALPTPLNPTSWLAGAAYPSTITRYAFVQVGSDSYVLGGVSDGVRVATVNRYNASTNTWTPRAAVPVASEAPSAAYYNGKIYLAEGDTGNSLRIYDIASNTWSSGANRSAAANGYGAAAGAYNGKLYVVGGTASASSLTSVYNIATNTWTTGTAAPTPFYLAGYHQDGKYLYIVGGFSAASPGANVSATMRLDMSNGTWTSGPAFTPQRADFALAMSGPKLYAIGGDANGGAFFDSVATVNELNTSSWPGGSWTASPNDLPSARQGNEAGFFSTARAGGEIWSTGGLQGATFTFLSDHVYRSQCPTSGVSRISENFDGVVVPALPNCWTAANDSGPGPLWTTSNSGTPGPTADTPPNSAFIDDPSTISDKRLDSPMIPLHTSSPVQLTFRSNYAFETNFDGGVLEISVDGGAFQDILAAGGTFASGGYNHAISSSFSNPIGGRMAWTGTSSGFITTTVNLPAAMLGHSVQFRWRMGSDSSNGSLGWRIDSVQLEARPKLTVAKAGSGAGTVSSNPAGIACGSTCVSRFNDGTSVTLTATAAAGSRFAGWSGGGCTGTGTCTVAPTGDTTVTATFILQHTLTVTRAGKGTGKVTSAPVGISCPATCASRFDLGTSVKLTPKGTGKGAFTGWSGDCHGKKPCVLAMTADHHVTATFQLCVVPKVVGLTLKKAKKKLAKAHCRAGKVKRASSAANRKGKVIKQSPKAGKKLKNGGKVNLTVGKGP